jgi:MFS family permease
MEAATSDQAALHRRATRIAVRRLLPLLMVVYFMACIDRTNVAMAKSALETDIGIGAAAYGLGAGIFFISYALFEIPSNVALYRVGVRWWIGRIAVSWGVIAAAMMFIQGPTSFYVMRFLLGMAEAGLYPGLMYLVTVWFAQEDRARVVGLLFVASTSAAILGSPIGGLLMQLDGVGGLHGWQWMFLLEGVISVVLGLMVWVKLVDRPSEAPWLTREEAAVLTERAEGPQRRERAGSGSIRAALSHPTVLAGSALYFLLQVSLNGTGYFGPAMAESMGIEGSALIGLAVGLVATGSLVGVLLLPWLYRRTGIGSEPRLILLGAVFGTLGSLGVIYLPNTALRLVVLGVTLVFVCGAAPIIWAFVMARVAGAGAAVSLAVVNTIGLIGGLLGPTAFGIAEDRTGDAVNGMFVVVAVSALTIILTLALRRHVAVRPPEEPADVTPIPGRRR